MRLSPKAPCAELLAEAMALVVVGGIFVFVKCGSLSLFKKRPMAEDGNKKREAEGREKLAYSRSCSGMSDPHSEVAPLCSWMVCSSSDSEGRSLKVLSSRPGASREKRRTRWGRGVAASGSAVLAGVPGWQGPSAPVESVTTGFVEMQPLFWFASASPSPAQQTKRVIYGLRPAWHTTDCTEDNGLFLS